METRRMSPNPSEVTSNPVVYILIENIVVDGIQHSIFQTPAFYSLQDVLSAKNGMVAKTGHTFNFVALPVVGGS